MGTRDRVYLASTIAAPSGNPPPPRTHRAFFSGSVSQRPSRRTSPRSWSGSGSTPAANAEIDGGHPEPAGTAPASQHLPPDEGNGRGHGRHRLHPPEGGFAGLPSAPRTARDGSHAVDPPSASPGPRAPTVFRHLFRRHGGRRAVRVTCRAAGTQAPRSSPLALEVLRGHEAAGDQVRQLGHLRDRVDEEGSSTDPRPLRGFSRQQVGVLAREVATLRMFSHRPPASESPPSLGRSLECRLHERTSDTATSDDPSSGPSRCR
jgi:hypothetical protein